MTLVLSTVQNSNLRDEKFSRGNFLSPVRTRRILKVSHSFLLKIRLNSKN